jgi:hypothetical protein
MEKGIYLKWNLQSKKITLILGFIVFQALGCGNKKFQIEVKADQKSVEVSSLDSVAREDWDMIEDLFLHRVYFSFLDEHHLEQDCIKCEDISLSYQCKIDDEGKVISITLHDSDIDCRGISDKTKKNMEDTFLRYFQSIVFPQSLRSKHILFTVGLITKC